MAIVDIRDLSRDFGSLKAVDKVTFAVEEGEIFGFLGPNGAGKTTTLSMLSTLLEPTSGHATVNGFDIEAQKDDVRKSIGIVFQDQSLDEELTAYENMDFHGRLYRVPKEIRTARIPELLRLVELEDREDDLVKTFSGGMRRRLEIARGLLHEPRVLFLDEPTLGLDPQTRNKIWEYVQNLNQTKKMTIILTTHYMDEADRLSNRVAIIDAGRIIAIDTPQKLKDSIGGDIITFKTSDNKAVLEMAKKRPWFKSSKEDDSRIVLNVADAETNVADLVSLACGAGIAVQSISINQPTLEDVFLHYTGKTIRAQDADPKDRMRRMRQMRGRR
ncbi:MAG: ATP-binding cassette domain-containing protein [Candidatus Altiarchaeota archaeon]